MKEVLIKAVPFGEFTVDVDRDGVRVRGEFAVEEIDLNVYVQVAFASNDYAGAKLYTYIDPWGDLEIGNLVDVPTQYEAHNLAIVKRLGDGYKGQARATVLSRYSSESAPEVPAQKLRDGSGFVPGFTPSHVFSGRR